MQPNAASKPDARAASLDDGLQRDARDLHAALSALVRLYQFRDRDRICCHDISVTQCHALEVLVEQGAQRSQALSAALRLDKSTTTRVVDGLVRKGYVERTPELDDRRAVSLRATASGKRLYHRINDELVAEQEVLLADVGPEVRRATLEVIRRLTASAALRIVGEGDVACGPRACAPGGVTGGCR